MKEYDSKNSNSMFDDEDELTVKQLIDGLEKLDQWNPVSTPNLQWFQQNVELEKKRIQKKQWKDLLTFISDCSICAFSCDCCRLSSANSLSLFSACGDYLTALSP